MKAQIRMIIASVIVIALALTAVSGITYSWFSDTEESKIDISTAVVDFEPSYTTNSTSSIGTTLTKGSLVDGVQQFTIEKLAANQQMIIISDIDNKSTVKTVYRMTATYTYTSTDNITKYDLQNIAINGTYLTGINAGAEGSVTITDWTLLNAGADPEPTKIVISTPTTYGDKNDDGRWVLPGSTTGYEAAGWDAQTERSGLKISIVIEAYQGDYPYTQMDTTTSTASAVIPTNKVVKADSIITSQTGSTEKVDNVVLDFSNVSKATDSSSTENNITGTKVTAEVTSISSTDSTVTIDLNLYSVSGGISTQIEDPQFDAPVVITMTVPGKITEPKITYNGEEDGTILSSTINSDDTTTVVFSVTHFSQYVIADTLVTTAEGLQASLNAGGYVKLGANITFNEKLQLQTAGECTIDLNKYTLNLNETYIGYNGCTKHSTGCSCGDGHNADVEGVNLIIQNGKLVTNTTGATAAFKVGVGSSLKLDSVDYDAQTGSGIFPRGNSAKVIVNDSTITAGCYGIGTNASTDNNYNVKIEIYGSKIITSSEDYDNTAVMINVKGDLVIKESELKADRQCLIVRAGQAHIYDTKMIYTGNFVVGNTETQTQSDDGDKVTTGVPWSDGNNVAKAAIVVGNMTKTSYYNSAWIFVTGVEVVGEDGQALNSELRALLMAKYMDGYTSQVQMNSDSICPTIQKSTYIENTGTGEIWKHKTDWTGLLT